VEAMENGGQGKAAKELLALRGVVRSVESDRLDLITWRK